MQQVQTSTRLHNLPAQRTSLIGREAEGAAVRERLLTGLGRLVTLTGVGGTGKTSLAVQVARELVPAFPDGVWLVELAPLADAALVPQALAAVLEVREGPERPLVDTLVALLAPRQSLVLLDNCEHLVDACAALVERLLSGCPQLRILATSREPLAVLGELTWRVPSLVAPDPARLPPLEELAAFPAVRLFVERAQAAQSSFRLVPQNAPAVAQLCARLDGIPLALELAAARVRVLPVEKLVARLDDAFHLLTGGGRGAPSRQQTLRATLDWSYDLLTDTEQALFRRLAVFAGGFDLEGVETVCAGDPVDRDEALDLVTRLVDKSLVVVEERRGEERYRLLEPLRQYARERLEAGREAEAAGRRHADHFLALAERAEPGLRGPQQGAWLDRLAQEHDNLRAALRWADESRATEQGLRLAGAVFLFWIGNGFLSEGQRWYELLLARGDGGSAVVRANALAGATLLTVYRGDLARAVALGEEGLALARASGDSRTIAWSLTALFSAIGYRGSYAASRALFQESLARYRQLEDRWGAAVVLLNQGDVARNQGDRAAAWALLQESAASYRAAEDEWGQSIALALLGYLALERGEVAQAETLAREGIALLRKQRARWKLPECLEVLAGVASARGQAEHAARLFGAAEALREMIGVPLMAADLPIYRRGVAETEAALEKSVFQQAWAEGRSMPLEQAIERALATDPPGPTRPAPEAAPVFISYSSQDAAVALHVCAALEDQQIRCWIAPRDVPPGMSYGEALIDAITASRLLVLVLSSSANISPQVRREVERAASLDIPILPFRIEDVPMSKALQYFLSEAHWLAATNPPDEQHLAALARAVQGALARSREASSSPPA